MASCEEVTTTKPFDVVQPSDIDQETSSIIDSQIISWQLVPPNQVVNTGETFSIDVYAELVNNVGNLDNITEQINWIFSKESIITLVEGPNVFRANRVGELTLTATLGAKTVQTNIVVLPAKVKSIIFEPEINNIRLGSEVRAKTVGILSDHTLINVTETAAASSSDPSGLVISKTQEGNFRIIAQKVGVYEVLVETTSETFKKPVEVIEAGLVSIKADPDDQILPKGLVLPVSFIGKNSDGSVLDISTDTQVSIEDETIITYSDGKLTALSKGHTLATFKNGDIVQTVSYAVSDVTLQNIELTASKMSVPIGLETEISAIATYSDGEQYDVSKVIDLSDDSSGNFILNDNIAKAVSTGLMTITGRFLEKTSQLELTANNAVMIEIVISPEPSTIALNSTGNQYTATAIYSDSTTTDITPYVSWSVEDYVGPGTPPEISDSPGSKGSITASSGAGTATIRASDTNALDETIEGTASITVSNSITSLRIQPFVDQFPSDSGSYEEISLGLSQGFVMIGVFEDGSETNISDQTNWYLDYYSSGLGNHGYLDRAALTLFSGMPLITTSQGSLKIIGTFEDLSAEISVTVVSPTIAENGLSCSVDSGSSNINIDETLSLDCNVTLTDGTVLDSTTLNGAGGWDVSWTKNTTGITVFKGSATFDDNNSATPIVTPEANGEGYLKLVATASAGVGRTDRYETLIKISRNCTGGIPYGGEISHNDNLFCWHVGTIGESCDTTCTGFGGYHTATSVYGSTLNKCNALASKIYTPPVGGSEGAEDPSVDDLGCSAREYNSFDTDFYKVYFGESTELSSASNALVKRFCACNQ